MPASLYQFFVNDHQRLDTLLQQCISNSGEINDAAYHEFRKGILRHISMEEKILLPAVQRLQGGAPHVQAKQIRLDHGAITALLVPVPTPTIIAALKGILAKHNPLEEGTNGLYEVCEQAAKHSGECEQLLEQVRTAPEVPVLPHNDNPKVMKATRRALERAGYTLDDFSKGKL